MILGNRRDIWQRLIIRLKRLIEVYSDKLLLWRFRNKPYIEYYRAVMKRDTAKDSKAATGAVGGSVGKRQLDRLIMYGLMPEHKLLDMGCGRLRGGLHFIDYLDLGNYTGNDISGEILEKARLFLHEKELEDKEPRLYQTNDMYFNEVKGRTFDYIHAQSVLSHMPPEDIESLFFNVSKIMHPDSQFFASFFLTEENNFYSSNQKRNFHYPLPWMREMSTKHGLSLDVVKDASEYAGKQKLLRITKD